MNEPPARTPAAALLADIRRDYAGEPLSEIDSAADPFEQFDRWLAQARELELDPTAMTLATCTADGRPSARTVLLKGRDARGFVFYTNYRSQKASEVAQTGRASLLFYWASVIRQVRIAGAVERIAAAESDAYFASRPLASRWSVYASRQSERVSSREQLDADFAAARERYGEAVPRPEWWGGFRVLPEEFEFWQGRPSRLHDRIRYARVSGSAGDVAGWTRVRLAP